MIWRVHIICFILDAYMTTPGIKSQSAKNNKFNKITESEIIYYPKFSGQKKLIFASEFNLFIPIKEHPFAAINRINDFFL
jgi:hypothetical protein